MIAAWNSFFSVTKIIAYTSDFLCTTFYTLEQATKARRRSRRIALLFP